MSEKYPGFFTAIFGGRKAKEPEPVKPKRKPKKKAQDKPLSEAIIQRQKILENIKSQMINTKVDNQSDETEGDEDE